MASSQELTALLLAWNGGDQDALEKLTPFVYEELHRLAKRYMAGERENHTLQATAVVNEAFLRLIDWKNASEHSAELNDPRLTRLRHDPEISGEDVDIRGQKIGVIFVKKRLSRVWWSLTRHPSRNCSLPTGR